MASMLPREYKLVQLNTGLSLTVAKDLEKATATLQEYVNIFSNSFRKAKAARWLQCCTKNDNTAGVTPHAHILWYPRKDHRKMVLFLLSFTKKILDKYT